MKVKLLALTIPTLLAATGAQAAEIYNKDGSKLDLYGRATFFDERGLPPT